MHGNEAVPAECTIYCLYLCQPALAQPSSARAPAWVQIVPHMDAQQTEAFEVVQELYASPRMLLAVLDRDLLKQVAPSNGGCEPAHCCCSQPGQVQLERSSAGVACRLQCSSSTCTWLLAS